VAAARRLRRAGVAVEVLPLVRPRGRRVDQVGLGARARAANVSGAFEVVPHRLDRGRGRAVVVVDDIVTSGATLAEVARVLASAGVPVLGAAAVAATPSRGRVSGLAVAAPRTPGSG
jgi:predicted amidophosphoribosyltransferase